MQNYVGLQYRIFMGNALEWSFVGQMSFQDKGHKNQLEICITHKKSGSQISSTKLIDPTMSLIHMLLLLNWFIMSEFHKNK